MDVAVPAPLIVYLPPDGRRTEAARARRPRRPLPRPRGVAAAALMQHVIASFVLAGVP